MKEREGRKRGRGKKGREERERKGGREGGRQTMCTRVWNEYEEGGKKKEKTIGLFSLVPKNFPLIFR